MDTDSEGIYSSPAFWDGVLYFGTDSMAESTLFALNAADGAVRWKLTVPTQIFSTPAATDGTVFFHARDDHVYAVSAQDGRFIWKTPAPSPQPETTVFSDMSKSSPAVAGGKIFVGIGRELVALDKGTGRVLWRSATKGKMDSSPLVVGRTVYAGSDDGRFYAFDIDSGEKTWEFLTGGKVSTSPSSGEGLIFIGSNDGYLYAFAHNH